ncbi:MAG: ribosomal L7Ae/L30e/S12e/Gadd45 family protein [Clostridia bacterium]|nr:ribosomal L7Ae/L30e/S12e/Gadd45 family protein [Clostridia bacterium]
MKGKRMRPGGQPQKDLTVGYNSSVKLVKSGGAALLYVASDCAPHIRAAAEQIGKEHGVPVDGSMTMAQLQQLCSIDVGCAVCAVRRKTDTRG